MSGDGESRPKPPSPISECRTIHGMMGFGAAIPLGSQILLKFIAILAEIVQQSRPMGSFDQSRAAFFGKLGRQFRHARNMLSQGMPVPIGISAVCIDH